MNISQKYCLYDPSLFCIVCGKLIKNRNFESKIEEFFFNMLLIIARS